MITNKEKNFVSAVVYLDNNAQLVKPFLAMLNTQLNDNFEKYEIICVNDACMPQTPLMVKEFIAESTSGAPVTLVNMSIRQGVEMCMNAGLDIAIGDFIFEFDTMQILYSENLVFDSYKKSLEGFDIVTVGPEKSKNLSSKFFYTLFNSTSNSKYKLQTNVFHILSRRAINRLHAINTSLPYRKAAYAASGLKLARLNCDMPKGETTAGYRMSQAMDALALYTNAAYKLSLAISISMLVFAVFTAVYTIAVYFLKSNTIEGWATTMFVLSAGFFGVFLILAIVIKYLSLLVELVFKNQKYLVESIEKL